jgi:hypothetical protein
MSDTTFVLLSLCALLLAVGPVALVAFRLIRSRFERGPVPMTYRDANGVEHTDTVDPDSVESIGKFLSRVRSHTSEAADAP